VTKKTASPILTFSFFILLVTALVGSVGLLLYADNASAAGGQSITRIIQPSSGDSWVDENNATTNYGTAATMTVHSQKNKNGRSLVQFSLPPIPTGSTVSSSTLQLYCTLAPTGRTHDVHRITVSWNEGTVTWNTPPPTFNATATASATTAAGWISWNVLTDVSAYVGGTATNYGWLVKDNSEGAAPAQTGTYATRENATTANRPKLSITFTAPWDSYQESGRTTIRDFFDHTYYTAYMKGTGFAAGTYNVAYYDAGASGGQKVVTDANITASGGVLNSQIDLRGYTSSTPGTWHALVQPTGGTAFDQDYNTAVANPDTRNLIANDSFTVDQSAIPEFPIVIAGIAVAGMCFGIYYWMRRRKLGYVKA
jgi:hypothetical protein